MSDDDGDNSCERKDTSIDEAVNVEESAARKAMSVITYGLGEGDGETVYSLAVVFAALKRAARAVEDRERQLRSERLEEARAKGHALPWPTAPVHAEWATLFGDLLAAANERLARDGIDHPGTAAWQDSQRLARESRARRPRARSRP